MVGRAAGARPAKLFIWDAAHGVRLADMNCDGSVGAAEIDAFSLALSDLETDAATYPGCHGDWAGDVNQDGAFDGGDIDAFFACLASAC